MRLASELLTIRRFLFSGVVLLTLLANFSVGGMAAAAVAWLCLLLLLIVYLFDITFHWDGAPKLLQSTYQVFRNLRNRHVRDSSIGRRS